MSNKQPETVFDFVNGRVKYDKEGQYLWINTPEGNQMLGELRGWGAIQNLYPLTLDGMRQAAKFQDSVGEWVAESLTALQGIPDPEQWVADMKAENERLKQQSDTAMMLDYLQNLNPDSYDVKYEINFQFWGPGKNQAFISKGGSILIEITQCETPKEAIKQAYEYFKRILP